MDVTVTRIGRTSLACRVAGYQEAGKCCFSGEFVCVFVDSVRVKPIAIPPQMRANIRRFADAQGSPFEDSKIKGVRST
jgi:acyl-CoA thioesterase FadM